MAQPAAKIAEYMTPSPHTLGVQQTLATAARVMREHGVRHLPVLDGGKLVGLLSERDVLLVEALPGVDPEKVRVDEAMAQEPYVTQASASLGVVAAAMARHKYGAAVIVEGAKVIGVFTTVDACRALAEAYGAAV